MVATYLALVEGLCFDLSLFFEAINNVLVPPTNFMREALRIFNTNVPQNPHTTYLHRAVLASRFQPQHSQRLRNNHSLLLVIRRWDTFKEFQSFESGSTPSTLMRGHTPNRSIENFGGGTMMEGARFFGVYNVALVQEIVVTKLERQY